MPPNPGVEAVLLQDGSLGVATETKPRKVQLNGRDNTCKVSLNRDWLEQLNIAEQGSPTMHSLSLARKPVVVQHPAVIVQPAAVLGEDHDA